MEQAQEPRRTSMPAARSFLRSGSVTNPQINRAGFSARMRSHTAVAPERSHG